MKKAKVAIASVLKPVTDVRAFNKLAISLRETNKYHINIIGFSKKNQPSRPNIDFTSIFKRSRLHWSRILVPFRFLRALFHYHPDILVVTTYELMVPAVLGKMVLGYQLVYDLQENYSKNARLNETMPKWLGAVISSFIKVVERSTHPFVDQYLMAEQCYSKEFPYINNFTVLENKYMEEVKNAGNIRLSQKAGFHFVISGTIAPVYGIEEAIQWFMAIHKHYPKSHLSIVGHVPLRDFRKKLQQMCQEYPSITLKLSSTPMPYTAIKNCLDMADIILLPYRNYPSISNKIPTKLYEALALHLPVLITPNPLWEGLLSPYPAGASIDFSSLKTALPSFQTFLSMPLYLNNPGDEVSWTSEKKKWIALMNALNKNVQK